ncbi:hypothetical protein BOTBODRAFT_339016 [Botryobasidium botryosum FD-172 SS1]|uniref:Uncharacterized protein n=1 Tax=Botryobasidium botryosum (strain FD-172 SS1) TaxID=930990 RepID=A0A067MJ03_BOTB1|nr:hypothetical protein BOTBODRAFT_339016 [Botryobasidium botryosum FD-172 SS1]
MFSFGRVIVEVFTLQKPFASIGNDAVIVTAVLKGELPIRTTDAISRGLDDYMWETVRGCAHRHASRRLTAQGVIFRLCAPPHLQTERRRRSGIFSRSGIFRES